MSKILFLTPENKIKSSSHRTISFLLYQQIYRVFTDVRTNNRGKLGRNHVTNILTSEDMENTPLASRM